MTLYLLRYNNYYNRILKKYDTLDEYEDYIIGVPLPNINFIPNDGITAKQVINWNYDIPDYLLAVDENSNIVSRWYVIESKRLLNKQFELTLFRDTLADYMDAIMQAPMYVEKAPLADSDPFIYNSEGMSFNQIKTREQILQDRYVTPWLIGFMSTDNPEGESGYSFTFERKVNADYIVTSIDDYSSVSGVSEGDYRVLQDWGYRVYGDYSSGGQYSIDYEWTLAFNSNGGIPTDYPNGTTIGFSKKIGNTNSALNMFNINKASEVLNSYIENIGSYEENSAIIIAQMGIEGEDAWQKAINENGKIIYNSSDSTYYQVKVDSDIVWGTYQAITGTNVWNKLVSVSDIVRSNTTLQKYANTAYNNDTFGYNMKFKRARVSIEAYNGIPITSKTVEIARGRNTLNDAPYCMFAIPYYDNRWCEENGVVKYGSVGPQIALDFVNSMSKALSGVGQLIDIQLLPYCPFQNRIVGSNSAYIDISGLVPGADYQFIEVEDTYHTGIMMYWCTESTFSFNISTDFVNPYKEIKLGDTVYQEGKPFATKLWNECTKYRLCAPNYASAFDFSPAKNDSVFGFNIDCTYKPYQPYIHINPKWSGLYGKDFDDPRGLIYTGDCSLTQLNDAWQTYQWQNINYEKTFQRQIQNLDVQQDYAKLQDKLNAVVGTFQGGITGASTGGLVGGGYGAIIGGAAGAAVSLAGGIADININQALRDEAKDYTIDMYNYNLGNIQALPTTISKISAFTANHKIFPLVEVYECSDMELQAFINKLKYNSCTVMRIGTLEEFLLYKNDTYNYFKGQLIRLEDISDDFHVVNTIAGELNKGVFI